MLRAHYPVRRRCGHTRGTLRSQLPDVVATTCDDGVTYTAVCRTRHGLLPQRLRWRVTPAGVEETAALTRVWGGLLLGVTGLVVAGTLVNGVVGTAFHVVAITAFVWLALEATWAGYLSGQALSVETTRRQYAGVACLVAACGVVAIVASGRVAAYAGAILALVVVVYTTTSSIDRLLLPLSGRLSRIETVIPVAPRRHILYAGCGAAALLGFSALYLDVRTEAPAGAAGVALVGFTGVGVLLWRIDSRRAARTHVAAALALTVGTVTLAAAVAVPTVAVASVIQTPRALAAQAVIAVGVLALWELLAYHHVATQYEAIDRFDVIGRRADTPTAAVFTYGVLAASVALELATLGGFGALVLAVSRADTLVPVAVALACAVPLAYFLIGTGYQLRELGQQVTAIRRLSCPVSPTALDCPLDPSHDVRLVDEGGFLAGAYYDPGLEGIVLSHGTIETLSPDELAAVIAHEESHFLHRGARLQFLLGVGCALLLLGKNVMYSLYDFREREFTADQHAVDRLTATLDDDGAAPLRSILDARTADERGLADSQLVGFFPTMASSPDDHGAETPALFSLFYGNSAGLVHPDEPERKAAIDGERSTVA